MTTVYVLTIEHRHGTDVSVHATRTGAEAALAAYVADWWDDEVSARRLTGPMPADPADAILAYFGRIEEWYSIGESELLP